MIASRSWSTRTPILVLPCPVGSRPRLGDSRPRSTRHTRRAPPLGQTSAPPGQLTLSKTPGTDRVPFRPFCVAGLAAAITARPRFHWAMSHLVCAGRGVDGVVWSVCLLVSGPLIFVVIVCRWCRVGAGSVYCRSSSSSRRAAAGEGGNTEMPESRRRVGVLVGRCRAAGVRFTRLLRRAWKILDAFRLPVGEYRPRSTWSPELSV